MHEPKDQPLTPLEGAAMFTVSPKTVALWAKDGTLNPIRTLGGDRRLRESEVRRVLEEAVGERE
ncbi:MAG: MerR family DNA-binding transcriptional regulator [Actinomycetota bacterium]|nr:MerR family DNA-binding transcriptional regulator [Actinomycetota bacterium]